MAIPDIPSPQPNAELVVNGFRVNPPLVSELQETLFSGESFIDRTIRVRAASLENPNVSITAELARFPVLESIPTSVFEVYLVGQESSWTQFMDATRSFIGDLGNVADPYRQAKLGFEVFKKADQDGFDVFYDESGAPLPEDFLFRKSTSCTLEELEESKRTEVGAGGDPFSNFYFEMTRVNKAGEVPSISMRVSLDHFVDQDKLFKDIVAYFASFNPDAPVADIIAVIRRNPVYAFLDPSRVISDEKGQELLNTTISS